MPRKKRAGRVSTKAPPSVAGGVPLTRSRRAQATRLPSKGTSGPRRSLRLLEAATLRNGSNDQMMAGSTVIGRKRKALQETSTDLIATSTPRKRLRSAVKPIDILPDIENDENVVPEEIQPVLEPSSEAGILDEEDLVLERFGDDDTPSRRAEKRGRKVTFAKATIDKHFSVSKPTATSLKNTKSPKANPLASAEFPAPQTSSSRRHKDALATPVTPKHKVQVTGRQALTPKTPRTPNGSAITVYNLARQLFARGADGRELIGRDVERETIRSFVEAGLEQVSGRSLYISGPPGTGKSAFTNSVTEEFKGAKGTRFAYVNCMSVRNTKDLHAKLLEDLSLDEQETEEDMQQSLRGLFFPEDDNEDAMYVITLDEIDHLLTLDLETLYTLFEWALDPSSRLILLGIANALDLTDRFLPRLKAKNLRPQLLPFVPYTVPEIASVITSRLQDLLPADAPDPKFVPFIQAPAIQLCAKKVASQTGDLRKAFDIIRRAIDLVETDVKTKYANAASPSASRGILSENENLSPAKTPATPKRVSSTSLSDLTVLTAPRASLAHLAKVTANAFNNGTSSRLKTLNLQQKATLCAIVSHSNRTMNASFQSQLKFPSSPFATPKKQTRVYGKPEPAPTVKELYETYSGLCKRDGALAPLTATEFADVVASLEGLGLVVEEKNVLATPRKSKGLNVGREEKRIRGCVSEQEAEGCLEGPGGILLKGLLRGE